MGLGGVVSPSILVSGGYQKPSAVAARLGFCKDFAALDQGFSSKLKVPGVYLSRYQVPFHPPSPHRVLLCNQGWPELIFKPLLSKCWYCKEATLGTLRTYFGSFVLSFFYF